jgi:phosphate-selective porin
MRPLATTAPATRHVSPLLIGLFMQAMFAPASARAVQEVPFTAAVSGYVQPRYTHVDPDDDDDVGSFGVRRARVTVRGAAYERFNYMVQVELAGSSTRIVDGWISHTLSPFATIAAGQAKAPFGRQQLTSDSGLQFVDRGILDPRFNPARQPGIWLSGGIGEGQVTYTAGVFNGEGMNVANDDGDFMRVARIVWTPLGSYPMEESALDFPEQPRLALGVAVLSTTIGTTDLYDTRRYGGEAAFKFGGLSAVAEYVQERLTQPGVQRDTRAWYAQAGFGIRSGYEIAVRYSTIDPDTPDALSADQKEKGFALSRYFEGHDMKIQADLLQLDSDASGTSVTQVRAQIQLAL